MSSNITTEQITAAQQAWGDGIVKIASAHKAGEDYAQVAHDHVRLSDRCDIGSRIFDHDLLVVDHTQSVTHHSD